MRPRNKRESIIMIEGLADVLSKGVPCTTGGYTPPAAVVGVRPEQITHRAFVRHLLYAVDASDVIQRIDGG